MLRIQNIDELTETSIKQDSPKIHIVFDIDDTLANRFDKNIEYLLMKSHLQRLKDDGLLIDATDPYLFHPGAPELIQWILKNPNATMSIFSDADEGKNKEFVHELLMRATGNDFNHTQELVSIYSRQHLDSISETDKGAANQWKFFKLHFGTKKKDLMKVLKIDGLDNVLMIENDPSYITYGQERNVLITRGTNNIEFYKYYRDFEQFPNDMEEELFSMNHIFFVAGILKKILGMNSGCLADNLFNLQYKSIGNGKYKRDRSLYKEHQYYIDGLSELQKINPKLEFYGGDLANEYFLKSNNFVVKC